MASLLGFDSEQTLRARLQQLNHDWKSDNDEGDGEQQRYQRKQHLHWCLIRQLLRAYESFLPALASLIGEDIAERTAGLLRLHHRGREIRDRGQHYAFGNAVQRNSTSYACA